MKKKYLSILFAGALAINDICASLYSVYSVCWFSGQVLGYERCIQFAYSAQNKKNLNRNLIKEYCEKGCRHGAFKLPLMTWDLFKAVCKIELKEEK